MKLGYFSLINEYLLCPQTYIFYIFQHNEALPLRRFIPRLRSIQLLDDPDIIFKHHVYRNRGMLQTRIRGLHLDPMPGCIDFDPQVVLFGEDHVSHSERWDVCCAAADVL